MSLLAVCIVVTVVACVDAAWTIDLKDSLRTVVSSTWGNVDPHNLLHKCRLREDPVSYLNASLSQQFVGQDTARRAVLQAVQQWDEDIANGDPHPLVLGFKGPSGVGKTETAIAVARAVLASTVSSGGGVDVPNGLVELRGEDYRDASAADAMLRKVFRVASNCDGNTVVIFDEAQKADPNVLSALAPAFERQLPALFDGPQRIDFSRAVFIIISDIGTASLKAELAELDTVNTAHLHVLGKRLTRLMDNMWSQTKIAGMFTAVIPFLPYRLEDVTRMIAAGGQRLAQDKALASLWAGVQLTPAAAASLSKLPFTDYEAVTRKNGEVTYFAAYGARYVFMAAHGPIQRLKAAAKAIAHEVNNGKEERVSTQHTLVVDAAATKGALTFGMCPLPQEAVVPQACPTLGEKHV